MLNRTGEGRRRNSRLLSFALIIGGVFLMAFAISAALATPTLAETILAQPAPAVVMAPSTVATAPTNPPTVVVTPATPPGIAVDIAPIIQSIAHTIGVLVLSVFAYWLQGHVKDEAARKMLLTGAQNMVSYAENHVGVTPGKPYTIHVASTVGAMALNTMKDLYPQAIKRLNLTDKSLAKIVVSNMPGIERAPGSGMLDPSTLDDIVAGTSAGKLLPPTDYGQISAMLGPLLEQLGPRISQSIQDGMAKHYEATAKPPATITAGVAGGGAA